MSNNVTPLVSICSITYNHKPYIRQCLDSLLLQKTNFIYEIIINDDCSTDGTTEIIKEYASKYPNLIHPIFHDENQYSKGVRGMFAKFCFPQARGKYIAMCEGDDYWTDPLKLQKQVDFLESHSDYVICGHRYKGYIENERRFIEYGYEINGTFDLQFMVENQKFCSTLSIVFLRSALHIEEYNLYPIVIDVVLFYHLLKSGKGYCLPDVMAVYTMHRGGIWSSLSCDSMAKMDIEVRLAIYKKEVKRLQCLYIL